MDGSLTVDGPGIGPRSVSYSEGAMSPSKHVKLMPIQSSLTSEELDVMCGVTTASGMCCQGPLTCKLYFESSKRAILKTAWTSLLFTNHDIRSQKVDWGKISMVDVEKKLLANALQDEDNQRFVLLSESCIPLQSFDFVYKYLMGMDVSFVDCFDDPSPHGRGRYSDPMLPEIHMNEWRKGAQWFTMTRQHALVIVAGGHGLWNEPLDSAEIYDPISNKWRDIARLPTDDGVES